jgi:hypothetical protein
MLNYFSNVILCSYVPTEANVYVARKGTVRSPEGAAVRPRRSAG